MKWRDSWCGGGPEYSLRKELVLYQTTVDSVFMISCTEHNDATKESYLRKRSQSKHIRLMNFAYIWAIFYHNTVRHWAGALGDFAQNTINIVCIYIHPNKLKRSHFHIHDVYQYYCISFIYIPNFLLLWCGFIIYLFKRDVKWLKKKEK